MQAHAAKSGLKQEAPEEQYAQDQRERDNDDLDETHSKVSY